MATKRPTSKTSGGTKPTPQSHAPLQPRPHPTTHAAAEKRNDNQSYKL